MDKECLKCGHTQRTNEFKADSACPKCGAIYSKVEAAAANGVLQGASRHLRPPPRIAEAKAEARPRSKIYQLVAAVVISGVVGVLGYQGFKYYKEQAILRQVAKLDEEREKNNALMKRAATDFLLAKLKSTLKDPVSAQFSDMKEFTRSVKLKTGEVVIKSYAVCGSINAKNSYGGYVGARPFYAETMLEDGSLSDELTDFEILNQSSDDGGYQREREKRFLESMTKSCKNELTALDN